MTNILLGGYYGAGNGGDEAILTVIIEELRKEFPNIKFTVLSWDPKKTSAEHKVESIYWKDIDALLDAALVTDLIVLGGGGIFHDYWGINPNTYLRKDFQDITAFGSLTLLADLLNIPCIIAAVGVGPLKTDDARSHTRLAFERCVSATVRDNESLEFLKEIPVGALSKPFPPINVAPDIVFRLVQTPEDEIWAQKFLSEMGIKGGPLLGISLRYWESATDQQENLAQISRGVKDFLESNPDFQVVTIPFQVLDATPHTNDTVVLSSFADLLNAPERVHNIEISLTPRQIQSLIKQCTILIGMRLHSIIMGINVGTPLVSLSYAPKVQSVMHYSGLARYCNADVLPDPSLLTAQLNDLAAKNEEIRQEILMSHKELYRQAKEHTRNIASFIPHLKTNRLPLQYMQEFGIQQTRYLFQAEKELEQVSNNLFFVRQERDSIKSQLEAQVEALLSHYSPIESSIFWRFSQKGYHLAHNTRLRYITRFFEILRDEGVGKAIGKIYQKLSFVFRSPSSHQQELDPELKILMDNMVSGIKQRSCKGVFVVTSAFVFDELYNQRVINLAKFLANNDWIVIYVAWRWHRKDPMPSIGGEVYKNVFQVPIDMFLDNFSTLKDFPAGWKKRLVIEYPHPDFFLPAVKLRDDGFELIYEIIDEWEEFHKVGQAVWFNKDTEEAFVINAKLVTAVAPSLVNKFSHLRTDILLSPNGYDPNLLGKMAPDQVSLSKEKRDTLHLGYFGHLTASWFDWDFLLSVLDLAQLQGINLHVHIIGYGEENLEVKMAKYSDRLTFYGKVHPSDLYEHAKHWDVAFIFFKKGKLSEAVDPIKIYEYLYFGLPVLVKGITHLYRTPFTDVVDSASDVLQILTDIQRNGGKRYTEQQEMLKSFVANTTWVKRFETFLQLLENK